MRLSELTRGFSGARVLGDPEVEVRGISYHSGRVKAGDLFVAVPGTKRDGQEFIPAALQAGAVAVLVGREPTAPWPVPAVIAPQVRLAMGQMAERFWGRPSQKLKLVGITGTNGKTTLAFLLEAVARQAGARPGVIGTVSSRWQDTVIPSEQTTPESVDLVRLLAEMAGQGVSHVFAEVSSHALDQKRVAGLQFAAGVFTNLTQDHLDYHPGMEAYFEAKRRLFTEVLPGAWELDRPKKKPTGPAVINLDDPYGRRLAQEVQSVITYGVQSAEAAYRAEEVTVGLDGVRFRMVGPEGKVFLSSPLLGRHNVMNLLAAAATSRALGFSIEAIGEGARNLRQVPGRLEPVPNDQGITVLVDYSHTPDALAHAVAAGRELSRGRLITLFGCGGDRDRGKRPQMGRIASQGSDRVIVTSDNPRSEEPEAIIGEIENGIERKNYRVEPDRRKAIEIALSEARPGDLVLLAGKGHEDYQILGSTKVHFDDREVAAEILARGKMKRSCA